MLDLTGYSLPMYFLGIGDMTNTVLFAGQELTSATMPPATCDGVASYLTCPADAFVFRGITLDPGMPCAAPQVDTDYVLSGKTAGPTNNVVVALTGPGNTDWTYRCVTAASDKTFRTTIRLGSEYRGTLAYFMVAVGDSSCRTFGGWDSSVRPLFALNQSVTSALRAAAAAHLCEAAAYAVG